jgi:hypothetical protein
VAVLKREHGDDSNAFTCPIVHDSLPPLA